MIPRLSGLSTALVLLAPVLGCRSQKPWNPTAAEQRALRDTLLALATQAPAFPSTDVSDLRLSWVDPEVALLSGTLRVPSTKEYSSAFTTLAFVHRDGEWQFKWAGGTSGR